MWDTGTGYTSLSLFDLNSGILLLTDSIPNTERGCQYSKWRMNILL